MADGHLNKCIDCTKADEKQRYYKNRENDAYVEKERLRGREKYLRLGYVNKCSEMQRAKKAKFIGLRGARKKFKLNLPRQIELHHWNYNILTEVIALDRRLHKRVHSLMAFDMDKGYYIYEGRPLDTIEKHLEIVRLVCERDGFNYADVKVYKK